ncbi:MAG: caspase family protein [Saprospiraceae bacterium]|nr:caspase family protein [Candidatus Vicinibacter proximus]
MKYSLLLFSICFNGFLFSQSNKEISKGVSPIPLIDDKHSTLKNTYAVVVGISDYQDKDIPDLRFADKDAEAFANFLRSPSGGSLNGDHLQVLTNTQATAGRLAEALDALIEKAKKDDQVIIYFSGHGDVEGKKLTQPGFLLCWDAPSRVYMGGGTYSLSFLQEVVSTLSVQNQAKVIVITDACHAGKLSGNQIGGAQLTTANLAKQYANEVKILSCQPNEFSLEGPQWGGGRGVFSYHLIDGLFGLADRNNDGQVTLGEIDRYLEDHVTGEAAPQSQIPILLGSKTEPLAKVDQKIMAEIKKNKLNAIPVFAEIDGKGIEGNLLHNLDTTIHKIYLAFNLAIKEKRFFKPRGNSAEGYFAALMREESLKPFYGLIKRNYAAALQDDAQQVINIWLAADVKQLECIGKTLNLNAIPEQLEEAAQLLGETHYMYPSIQARKFLFQGILAQRNLISDATLTRNCMKLFEKSKELEPQSPLPWYCLSQIYVSKLKLSDSAFIAAQFAKNLAPNWVLPFADLAHYFNNSRQGILAKKALQEAEAIDSLHPYVINRWADWNLIQGNKMIALDLYLKYRLSGGKLYTCWHNNLAMILQDLGKFKDTEVELLNALALDSTNAVVWVTLAENYRKLKTFDKTESALKKAISLQPNLVEAWVNLGQLYIQTQKFNDAEYALKKSIALDSSMVMAWGNLGDLYRQTKQYVESEIALKKVIALDSNFYQAHYMLGMVCYRTLRMEEANKYFLKARAINPKFRSSFIGLAYVLVANGKAIDAIGYVEQAINLGVKFEQLENDQDLKPLHAFPEWKSMLKKYFPDTMKE